MRKYVPGRFVLAMEHSLTLRVFDVNELHQLAAICAGARIGTLVETPDD